MAEIFEAIMIISFGISWPLNLYKSIKTKSTKGKSILFLSFILLGYLCGITGKIISNKINWVFIFYIINCVMVLCDFIMYFINLKRESKLESNNNM